jgi:endo-1,4-beta-xylanase
VSAVAALALGVCAAVPAFAGLQHHEPQDQSLRQLASRHGLKVGTAINVDALADTQYRQIASTQFSTVTAENVMKWDTLEPTRGSYNWGPAEQFMAFAKANHQQVRGHVLVWSNQLPKWLTDGVSDGSISDADLRGILENHIKTVVSHFKGRIWQWDVVNEAVTDSWDSQNGAIGYKGFWYQHLGAGYVADSFRWARQADPKALLFYNDYNIDAFGDHGPLDKTEFVYQMVKQLRAARVPIDGVGSQGHLSTRYGNYSAFQIADALQRFAGLGVATALTEVDVRNLMPATQTGDTMNPLLQAQAFNYSALMQGCLASQHCISFTVWGFDDGHSWTNTWDFGNGAGAEAMATIYDASYQPKPAYRALQADLAYSGPPLVKQRIAQRPTR